MSDHVPTEATDTVAGADVAGVIDTVTADDTSAPLSSRTRRSKSVISDKPHDDINKDKLTTNVSEDTAPDDPSKDDSEAETVLSSPVKRKEELKKSNGLKSRLARAHQQSDLDDSDDASAGEASQDNDTFHHQISRGKHKRQNGTKSKESLGPDAGDANGDDGPDDQSDLSDASLSSEAPSALALAGEIKGENGNENSNPKKRKHRVSSFGDQPADPDSVKRPRRASEYNARVSDRNSDDLSPEPRLRRKKRTSSMHTANQDDPELVNAAGRGGRARRAASNVPVRGQDPKAEWQSESDSDDLKGQAQSRSTRNLNRSVSTPGRPQARDHKRHVNKYGFTRLAEACESGDLEAVKEWREKDPEQLEQREFAGNTPLQVASLNGYPELVQYLLAEGCNPHCANTDKDTPLIDAVENGHTEVVRLLLDAGVDPTRQNMKGQQALDVITDDTEDGVNIRALLKKAIENWKMRGTQNIRDERDPVTRLGPRQGLHFMARTPENLLKLVSNIDLEGVKQFLDARVPVDNNIVAAAAKTGDTYLVNMLLAEMSPKKARSRAEKPMLAVLGSSHFEMVKNLTELDQFNPTWRAKNNGLTWYELAEGREGPHWKEEKALLLRLYTEAMAESGLSSSPISKRDGGIRRLKTPPASRDSDDNLDNEESPDVGRAKRRLVPKKDMRTTSARKSPSAESARPTSSPEIALKPGEEEHTKVRKVVGRPRTKSMSVHGAPEVKTKRIKSGPGEKIALFGSGAPVKRRKIDEASTTRPASDAIKQRNHSIVTTTDKSDVDMSEIKSDEDGKSEMEKAKSEEAARVEREKVEKDRQEEQARVQRRQQKLQLLPSALRMALDSTDTDAIEIAAQSAKLFLPLQSVLTSGLGEARDGDDKADMVWVPSYQAAGLLRGPAGRHLVGIEEPEYERLGLEVTTKLRTRSMDSQHRQPLLARIRAGVLAAKPVNSSYVPPVDQSAAHPPDDNALPAEKEKFLSMPDLKWVNLRDLLILKATLQLTNDTDYQHLQYLTPIVFTHNDALDNHEFRHDKHDGNLKESLRFKWPTNSSPSPPATVIDKQLRVSLGDGLKERDGECFNNSRRVLVGKTKIQVVVD